MHLHTFRVVSRIAAWKPHPVNRLRLTVAAAAAAAAAYRGRRPQSCCTFAAATVQLSSCESCGSRMFLIVCICSMCTCTIGCICIADVACHVAPPAVAIAAAGGVRLPAGTHSTRKGGREPRPRQTCPSCLEHVCRISSQLRVCAQRQRVGWWAFDYLTSVCVYMCMVIG